MKKRLRKKSKYIECSHLKEEKEWHSELPYGGTEYFNYCLFSEDCKNCLTCKSFYVSMKDRKTINEIEKYHKKHWNNE